MIHFVIPLFLFLAAHLTALHLEGNKQGMAPLFIQPTNQFHSDKIRITGIYFICYFKAVRPDKCPCLSQLMLILYFVSFKFSGMISLNYYDSCFGESYESISI